MNLVEKLRHHFASIGFRPIAEAADYIEQLELEVAELKNDMHKIVCHCINGRHDISAMDAVTELRQDTEKYFRAGLMWGANKYALQPKERFTGNDVAMFLEMESFEVDSDDIATAMKEVLE
mgnify:CR=1 FL=1